MTDVIVTQEDREAVYRYLCDEARYAFTPVERLGFRNGERDDNPLVQAFARHRIKAALAMQERAAKVLEHWLPRWEADWKKHDDNFWEGGRDALEQSLAAIRNLEVPE